MSIKKLGVNQAYVQFESTATHPLHVYALSDECCDCPFSHLNTIRSSTAPEVRVVESDIAQSFHVYNAYQGPIIVGHGDENASALIARFDRPHLGNFGTYRVSCSSETCQFAEIHPPYEEPFAVLYFALIVGLLAVAINAFHWWRQIRHTSIHAGPNEAQLPNDGQSSASVDESSAPAPNEEEAPIDPPPQPTKQRLHSLDTFRGLAIALMIFVNTGPGYWWLEHAAWNGVHVADVVFPAFLWIMGVCIPMSLAGQIERNVNRWRLFGQVLRRSAMLFVIGLCLNSAYGTPLVELRTMGILQRFGVTYAIVGGLYILFFSDAPGEQRFAWLADVRHVRKSWLVMLAFVAVYLAIVFGLPVPDCPRGYLGPGGLAEQGRTMNHSCGGGASAYVDRLLLTDAHLYANGRLHHIYKTNQRIDPEGLFGCLLSAVTVQFGVQCGCILRLFRQPAERLRRMAVWSAACAASGALVAIAGIPLNKTLWSLSYVLVMAAFDFALLAGCYACVDVRRWWSGAPFRWAGMNSIVLYVGHMVQPNMLPFRWRIGIGVWDSELLARLLDCGWHAGVWLLIAWWMHRRRWFVSV